MKTVSMGASPPGNGEHHSNGVTSHSTSRVGLHSQPRTGGFPRTTPHADSKVDHTESARRIKQEYTRCRREPGVRGMDSIHALVQQLMDGESNLDAIFKTVVKTVYSQFSIKDVSISTKGEDGLFRYREMQGMRDEVWAAHRNITYSLEQVLDPNLYKGTDISKFTKLYLAEDDPYSDSEKKTCIDHLKDSSRRKNPEDSIEGDYLDIFMFGPKDEILGWIEISGTWDNKLPDARTIRGLEVLSSVLALAIVKNRAKQR